MSRTSPATRNRVDDPSAIDPMTVAYLADNGEGGLRLDDDPANAVAYFVPNGEGGLRLDDSPEGAASIVSAGAGFRILG